MAVSDIIAPLTDSGSGFMFQVQGLKHKTPLRCRVPGSVITFRVSAAEFGVSVSGLRV